MMSKGRLVGPASLPVDNARAAAPAPPLIAAANGQLKKVARSAQLDRQGRLSH
jgi:hypothetical protein